ncbi:GH92 family glycosyl hydrolase [bacterium]|nr:GH92 family glycosyl hydrolase [bacterium]
MRILIDTAIFAIVAGLVFAGGCVFGDDEDTSVPESRSVNDDADDDVADDDAPGDGDGDGDPVTDPLPWVDPFIGTGGLGWGMGAMTPGAFAPFGLVKMSPDTSVGGLMIPLLHAGGYWWPDNTIRGMSHLHLPGTGIADLGNINLMPVMDMDDARVTNEGYRSGFRHASEEARPGYYRVHLDRYDITVESTATPLTGLSRYTFPNTGAAPHVVVDVSYSIVSDACRGAQVTIDPARREVYGYTDQHGTFSKYSGGMKIYFAARFDADFVNWGTSNDDIRFAGATHAGGDDIAAYVGFAPGTKNVEARVGISLVSVEQARRNLDHQTAGRTFDEIASDTAAIWRDLLSDILVSGGTPLEREIFYTAMDHLYVLPTSITEAGGLYVGFDRQVHVADGFTYYTDLSLWDTFRTFHPLLTLLRPDMNRDIIVSMIRMYEQGGAFPMWAQGLGETEIMIGSHADTVVADAYLKGLTNFDIQTAWEGLRAHAMGPVPYAGRPGIEEYIDKGYVPYRFSLLDESVSMTLEYALNDYCLGRLAEAIGEDEDAAMFLDRAQNYRNLWDSETNFFRARRENGDFVDISFPEMTFFLHGYTEGNAYHWRWFVPHDLAGLVELFGGQEPFLAALTDYFELAVPRADTPLHDKYYWHGNEPNIHASYLFNVAGRPDLTAKWVRWAMREKYDGGPHGLDGNDDGGTLSAWYIFSALGFYPLPCTDLYLVGSPLFTTATVRMGDRTLVVTAQDASPENIYVQSLAIDGEPIDTPWFTHERIANGGTIEFVMGPAPSDWGAGANLPPIR